MKRFWGHLIAVVGIAAGAVGMNSACAHDDSTIFIRNAIYPPASQGLGLCTYTNDPSQPKLNSGTLDTAFTLFYSPAFLVGNQMTPRGNPDNTQTETSRVEIQGAIVRLTDVAGNELRPSFTRSAAGFLDPAIGGQPGYGTYQVLILDDAVTQSVRTQGTAAVGSGKTAGSLRVMAYIKFFGHTLGGIRVETNEFQFPIDVCYGCLVQFPQGVSSNLPGDPQPNCKNSGTGGSTSAASPCVLGQDQPIDCRICVDTHKDVCGGGGSSSPVDAGPG